MEDLIGLIAGTLTTISFLPQVIKTWRSKSAKDLSLVMYSLFTFGVVLWLAYGVINGMMPIIVSNTVTLVLAALLLVGKIRYK